jgi:DNA-binding NarL/FixJ family response regulator
VVGQAHNGEKAVELAAEQKPDIVLMDIQMPHLDGVEAAKQIKKTRRSARVLMLTGSSSSADVARAKEAGAEGYVTKDRIASELIDSIVEVAAK